MNLSTSSSEPVDPRWRSFPVVFAAAAALVFAALLGFLAALDPYDTGRLALARRPGVARQGPRTADASRGRDPRFNAAIFGNSHIQLIRPETLKAQTGLDFVSLTVPATYPKEQFVLIDWFLRHHPRPAAIVVGLDVAWCLDTLNNVKPFPFWLYDQSTLAYLRGLVRYSALEHIPGRLALLFGAATPARADGYQDYEADYRALNQDLLRAQLDRERPTWSVNGSNAFPAADALRALLGRLSPSSAVVLVWPPVHISAFPLPGSPGEATLRACHASFSRLASERPGTAIVDWAVDRPETRQAENFFDQSHYRDNLAEPLQADVAAALNAIRRSP
jgi:hypothetical protein